MTEENNLTSTALNQETTVKIYSKKAILGFSIFFAPVFGGFLLRQNLIDSDRKKESNVVVLVSIGLTAITFLIANTFEKPGTISYLLNWVGGAVLSEYFFKKYFPADNYEYKKIWKPLFISIAIISPFLIALIFTRME